MGVNILMFLHPPRSRRGWWLLSFLPPLTLLTEPSFLKQITAWPLSDRPPMAPMAHKVGNSPQSLQGCAITTPLYVPPCQHKRHTSPPPLGLPWHPHGRATLSLLTRGVEGRPQPRPPRPCRSSLGCLRLRTPRAGGRGRAPSPAALWPPALHPGLTALPGWQGSPAGLRKGSGAPSPGPGRRAAQEWRPRWGRSVSRPRPVLLSFGASRFWARARSPSPARLASPADL